MTETVGDYLRKLRVNRGLMQKQLAASIGVEPSYLSNLERGIRVHLGEKMLKRISEALQLTPEELAEVRRYRDVSRTRITFPPYAAPKEIEVVLLLTGCLGRMPPENFEVIRNYIETWRTITLGRPIFDSKEV
ncbi:MAG: helix-turn-helix domain-containing protein [Moraxellaceae bacterium]